MRGFGLYRVKENAGERVRKRGKSKCSRRVMLPRADTTCHALKAGGARELSETHRRDTLAQNLTDEQPWAWLRISYGFDTPSGATFPKR